MLPIKPDCHISLIMTGKMTVFLLMSVATVTSIKAEWYRYAFWKLKRVHPGKEATAMSIIPLNKIADWKWISQLTAIQILRITLPLTGEAGGSNSKNLFILYRIILVTQVRIRAQSATRVAAWTPRRSWIVYSRIYGKITSEMFHYPYKCG